MQAVGNWSELPEGGGPKPTGRPTHAAVPMGLRYAGHKTARSAQVKLYALDCFMKLWKRKQPELALNDSGLVPADSWSWQEVCATAALHNLAEATPLPPLPNPEPDQGAIEVAPGALEGVEAALSDLPVAAEGAPSEAASDTDSSMSPSASDESADGQDLVGIIPPDDAVDTLKWFLQGTKVHILRHDSEEGERLPWCRDVPYAQEPQRIGEGLATMNINQICQLWLDALI